MLAIITGSTTRGPLASTRSLVGIVTLEGFSKMKTHFFSLLSTARLGARGGSHTSTFFQQVFTFQQSHRLFSKSHPSGHVKKNFEKGGGTMGRVMFRNHMQKKW
jgi:hypothetical protein